MADEPRYGGTERKKHKGGKPLFGVVLAQAVFRCQKHGKKPPYSRKIRENSQQSHCHHHQYLGAYGAYAVYAVREYTSCALPADFQTAFSR